MSAVVHIRRAARSRWVRGKGVVKTIVGTVHRVWPRPWRDWWPGAGPTSMLRFIETPDGWYASAEHELRDRPDIAEAEVRLRMEAERAELARTIRDYGPKVDSARRRLADLDAAYPKLSAMGRCAR